MSTIHVELVWYLADRQQSFLSRYLALFGNTQTISDLGRKTFIVE